MVFSSQHVDYDKETHFRLTCLFYVWMFSPKDCMSSLWLLSLESGLKSHQLHHASRASSLLMIVLFFVKLLLRPVINWKKYLILFVHNQGNWLIFINQVLCSQKTHAPLTDMLWVAFLTFHIARPSASTWDVRYFKDDLLLLFFRLLLPNLFLNLVLGRWNAFPKLVGLY